MKDSLLNNKSKKEILSAINSNEYSEIVSILEKIKTSHAGTPKTKDKRFVIREIVKHIIDTSGDREKDFFIAGSFYCSRKEDVSKEIGVSLIWRGYKFNKEKVKEALLKIAGDPNWEVREYAANAFADTLYHNPEFYNDVMKWTKHHSENVRRAVVFSALSLREKEHLHKAFSIFEPLLFDSSKYVRKNLGPFILGSYFGNKYPKETIRQLKKWSKIRDENVRWNVIMSFNNSFGNKYPGEAFDVLKNFTGDVDLTVKRALKSTLNHLSKRHKILVEEFTLKHGLV
ncbi:MAG: DNA alkylation repair protein [Ignavibacteria bacterium]|nr:DNA alkylation repair protein [Ignavibacteria bacterium]